MLLYFFFFFQAEDGIRDIGVTGVQTCALPIYKKKAAYYAGIQIGQQISNQMIKGINSEVFGTDSTKSISLKNFLAGFVAGTTGKSSVKMTMEDEIGRAHV